jgi:hypothetical protein
MKKTLALVAFIVVAVTASGVAKTPCGTTACKKEAAVKEAESCRQKDGSCKADPACKAACDKEKSAAKADCSGGTCPLPK